jgi:hypothetical protein
MNWTSWIEWAAAGSSVDPSIIQWVKDNPDIFIIKPEVESEHEDEQ